MLGRFIQLSKYTLSLHSLACWHCETIAKHVLHHLKCHMGMLRDSSNGSTGNFFHTNTKPKVIYKRWITITFECINTWNTSKHHHFSRENGNQVSSTSFD